MKSMPLALVLVNALVLMEKKTMLFIESTEITTPRQCTHYTSVKELRIDGIPTTIYTDLFSASLCTKKQPKNRWYRFNSTLNMSFKYENAELFNSPFNSPANKECSKNGVPLHPCRVYESIMSTVCFNNTFGRSIGRTVNITNCGSFYVYQLFQLNCKKNSATISRTFKPHTNCNVSSTKDPKVVMPTSFHITERKLITMTTRLISKMKQKANMTTQPITKTKKPLDITMTITNTMAKTTETTRAKTTARTTSKTTATTTAKTTSKTTATTTAKTTPKTTPKTTAKTTSKTTAKTTSNTNHSTTAQFSTSQQRTTTKRPTTFNLSKCWQNELDNDVFRKLKNQVNMLESKNVSQKDREKEAKDIIKNLSDETNLDKKNEAEKENGIKPQALNDTVRILKKIVGLNISAGNLKILGPANNILDRRNRKAWRILANDTIIRDLVNTLEEYAFQYVYYFKKNASASPFVSLDKQNFHLQARYIKNANKASNKEISFMFSNGSFNLSPDALSSETIVAVVWYKTIHSFISNTFRGSNIYGEVKREIVTASVRPDPRGKFEKPVRISWNVTGLNNYEECVFWKPKLNENKWKTEGCSRKRDELERLTCECNHLTAFATLDISRDLVNVEEKKALELISTIGCSLSLVGILFTILTYALLWKKLQLNVKSNIPSHVLIHLCVAIGMTDIFAILAGPARSNEVNV